MATDNTERIDKFLRDQMTPEETDAFLRDMELDEELRKEAQLTALMIQDLQERQVKRDSEITAIFLLLFGVYTYQSNFTKEDGTTYIALADKYYNQTPKALFRSGANDLEHELDSLFAKVGTSEEMTSTINRLQEIHESIDSVYVYSVNGNDIRIKWFLALAFLKDGQKGKATELLSTIVKDDKGTYLKEEAEQLLKDIDKQ